MRRVLLVGSLATVAGGLAACEPEGPRPPTDVGVCWHMITPRAGGEPRFNRLAENVSSLEQCAARLEAMRLRFNGMGARQEQVTGAYQGRFLFLRSTGIFTATRFRERGYLALVRTADGRLAQPGAVRQPPRGPPA